LSSDLRGAPVACALHYRRGFTGRYSTEVIALIRAGLTYANVHSSKFTGGEVRSQIDDRDDDRDGDSDDDSDDDHRHGHGHGER
jgi:hypothetical protein